MLNKELVIHQESKQVCSKSTAPSTIKKESLQEKDTAKGLSHVCQSQI